MAEGIRFTITGHPVAKQRPRTFVQGGKVITTTLPKTRRWEDDARMVARVAMGSRTPLEGCLKLSIRIYLAVPPSWPKWKRRAALDDDVAPSVRPDLDNFVKAVKDSLNGIVYLDDSQVIELEAGKLYSKNPGVEVEVWPQSPLPAGSVRKKDLEDV